MTDIFDKYRKLRELYPEDIAQIEREEKRVADLLKRSELGKHAEMKALVAECRRDVVFARRKLATDRALGEDARRELWALVDARLWVVERLVRDFDAEIAEIERSLERDLTP
jgi:hypothetical protein